MAIHPERCLEEGRAAIQQERNISARFRLHSRSAALFQHRGKVGLGLLVLFMLIVTLSVAIPCWEKSKCEKIGPTYQLCNRTLRTSENGHCYSYQRPKERKKLKNIYRDCVTKWPDSPPRCERQVKVVTGNETSFLLPTVYDHTFFMRVDENDKLDVQTLINETCILNNAETSRLFRFLWFYVEKTMKLPIYSKCYFSHFS